MPCALEINSHGGFKPGHVESLILFFSKILSIVIFHSAVDFQQYQIFPILLHIQKVTMARNINAMNKKSFSKYLLTDVKKSQDF